MRNHLLSPSFLFGIALVSLVVIAALFPGLLSPFSPDTFDLHARLTPPGSAHYLLGTDPLGRDMLTRIIYGSRIALTVGLLSVILTFAIGTIAGLVSGYYGGIIDALLMRLVDIQLSFPFILFAITVIAVIGPGLWKVILIMAVTQWVQFARIERGQVLSIKEVGFIQAAKSLGATDRRIILMHLLPNTLAPLIVLATLNIANNILLEASLSFLGLGVSPNVPSWGGMIADGRNYLQSAWWVATFPGFALAITVLGFNLLGDWLRDVLDPRSRK